MIHWLQTLLEKHLKWVFIGLLAVIIVSFVFSIGAVRGIGDPKTKLKENTFYGFDLNKPEVVKHLQKGALFSQYLGTAPFFLNQNQETSILARATLLHLAETLLIPNPTEDLLTEYIKTDIHRFQKEDKSFDAAAYEQFLKAVNESPEFGAKLAAQLMAEEYKIHLVKPYLGSSLVLPYEATYQEMLAKTQWDVMVAILDKEGLPKMTDPALVDLEAYYAKNNLRYESPSKRQISYIVFPSKNFVNHVSSPTTEDLKALYEQNPRRFVSKNTDNNINNKEKLPFEEADQEKIKNYYYQTKSKKLAYEAAEICLLDLYEHNIQYKSEAFNELLKRNQCELLMSDYFSKDDIPQNLPFNGKQLMYAFNLDTENYYSDVIQIASGAGMYFFDNETPGRILTFDECKNDVLKDYTKEANDQKFSETGQSIYEKLKNVTAESLQSSGEALGLSMHTYTGFNLETPPNDIPGEVLMLLPQTPLNKLTSMVTLDNKGYYIYITKKTPAVLINENEEGKITQIEQMTKLFTESQFLENMIEYHPDNE